MSGFTTLQGTHPQLVVAGLIEHGGKFLIAQRPSGDWMEGYWEFPGGKLHPFEDPRKGLEREIQEELSLQVQAVEVEEVLLHRYPDRTVLLLFFHCKVMAGEPSSCLGQTLRWASPSEMAEMKFLPADFPVIKRLLTKDKLLDSGDSRKDLRDQ